MTHGYEDCIHTLLETLNKAEYQSRKFVIYGTGMTAQYVIEALSKSGRTLVGLMDRDTENVGESFYGCLVISEQEAIEKADCIIIAANDMHWIIIADRIAHLRDIHGKTILYTNGEKVLQSEKHSARPHELRLDKLYEKTDRVPVVCFDVFDTLITRNLSEPGDIFLYIGKNIDMPLPLPFSIIRKAAEDACRREYGDVYTIDDIYRRMEKDTGITQEQASLLLKAELAAELRFAAPKKEMARVFFKCLREGKRVYLVSDMYLYARQIERILLKCGISGYHGLFVSSEIGVTKASGAIWPKISSITGSSFVHIGDDESVDILPLKSPDKTFHVPNYRDRLSMCGLGPLKALVKNWEDSLALGLLTNQLFGENSDGFEKNGRPLIVSPYNFGYLFFAPLLLTFTVWMIDKIKTFQTERVYFCSRDGHMLMRLYEEIVSIFGIDVPEPVYLKISRRVVAVAGFRNEDDIVTSLKQPFSATVTDILKNHFGIDACVENDETLSHTDPRMYSEIMKRKEHILANSILEREEYLEYLRKAGMSDNESIVICDYGTSATIQFWLEKVLNRPLNGVYLSAYTGELNPYGIGGRVDALFPVSALGAVYRFSLLLEAVLCAPGGTVQRVFADGRIDSSNVLERPFDVIQEIHDGVSAYVKEYAACFNHAVYPSKELAAAIFALPGDGYCAVDEKIKNACLYDDSFLAQIIGKPTI